MHALPGTDILGTQETENVDTAPPSQTRLNAQGKICVCTEDRDAQACELIRKFTTDAQSQRNIATRKSEICHFLDERRNPIGPVLMSRLDSRHCQEDKAILNSDGKRFDKCI